MNIIKIPGLSTSTSTSTSTWLIEKWCNCLHLIFTSTSLRLCSTSV